MNVEAELNKFNLTVQQKQILADHLASLLPAEHRQLATAAERAERWRRRYARDPVAFARDCVRWPEGQGLTPYQEEILAELPRRARVAVTGPRGLGKTALASLAVNWYAATRDTWIDWKVVCTAGGQRQLEKFLFPEVLKFARRLRWDRIGRPPWRVGQELMKQSIAGETGAAFCAVSSRPDLVEGAHASHVAVVIDEAKSVPAGVFDSLEGVLSNAGTRGREALTLVISTPGRREGRLFDIFDNKDGAHASWWTRHVTLDEVLRAEMVSEEWVRQRAREWGTDSALYRTQVLGEFCDEDESGVIPSDWVLAAQERAEPDGPWVGTEVAATRG